MSDNLYLIYIDESYDETHFAYSAIFINAFHWNDYFKDVVHWRGDWLERYGIAVDYELHATDFVGGRGKFPENRDKAFRADLFYESLGFIEQMRNILIINAITDKKYQHMKLFGFILNRINRTLKTQNSIGILICDEGNEKKLTATVRQMKKHNPIPNHAEIYGAGHRNIPLDRIIEDPLFKTSKSSYFIQLADFVAFSLLRSEKPLPNTQPMVFKAFDQLDKVLVKHAFKADPKKKGIVRC